MADQLINRQLSHLLMIDIQDKLVPTIHAAEAMNERVKFVLAAARPLGIPITVSEQYPKGLGPTFAPLREAVGPEAPVFSKTAFSCFRDDTLRDYLTRDRSRHQLVIMGIEAHVCVLQTAFDALSFGFDVFIVEDAVSSRSAADRDTALCRMSRAGIQIVSAEMVFFEWLERAGTPEFKALSPMLK